MDKIFFFYTTCVVKMTGFSLFTHVLLVGNIEKKAVF